MSAERKLRDITDRQAEYGRDFAVVLIDLLLCETLVLWMIV